MLTKRHFYALLLLLGCLSPTISNASHLVGGGITWKRLGSTNDSYIVTVTNFRDCNGIAMNEPSLEMKACKSSTLIGLYTSFKSGKEITGICKKTCTRCKKGKLNTYQGNPTCSFQYGFEEFTYKIQVSLKKKYGGCCNFQFSWATCCRNTAITTGSANEGFYVEASLNRCVEDSMSPEFNTSPKIIACKNMCTSIDLSAKDFDVNSKNGKPDSLVYYLSKPVQAIGSFVTYSSGYNYNKPLKVKMPSSGLPDPNKCEGFLLDSQTGILRFTPTKSGEITTYAITIESWGYDTSGTIKFLKSKITRDIELITINCPMANAPAISGFDSNNYSINLCEGKSKCWNLTSYDKDSTDTLTISWKNSPHFQVTNLDSTKKVQHPRTKICFTADSSTKLGNIYNQRITATDDACPFNLESFHYYTINVVKPIFNGTNTDTAICAGDSILIGPAPISGHVYLWLSNASTSFTYTGSQFYSKPSNTIIYGFSDSVIGLDCKQTNTYRVRTKTTGCLNSFSGQIKTSTGGFLKSSPVYLLKFNPTDSIVY